MHELAAALIAHRDVDDCDPGEWVAAITEAQFRVDISVLRGLVETFLTKK